MKPIQTLGQVCYDDFDRASLGTAWTTALATATATISGNELLLANGSGLTTEYIRYNAFTTCLEKWRVYTTFQCTAKNATSHGLAIGLRGLTNAGGGQRSVFAQVSLSSGANGGKTFIYTQSGASAAALVSTAGSAIAFSLNDELAFELLRNFQTITATIYNVTTGASVAHSFTLNTNPAAATWNATAQMAIYLMGGTQTLHNISLNSDETTNANVAVVGDSITYGAYTSTSIEKNTLRWSNQAMLYSSLPFVVLGGPGDDTANVLLHVGEIIRLSPKYVLLMIGGNDILYGVAAGIYQANYKSIRNTLTLNGIKVIHCLATPRTTTNITAINTFILSEYTNVDFIVDTYTPLKGAGTSLSVTYDSGDGVHPNAAGHALAGTTVRQSVPFIFN